MTHTSLLCVFIGVNYYNCFISSRLFWTFADFLKTENDQGRLYLDNIKVIDTEILYYCIPTLCILFVLCAIDKNITVHSKIILAVEATMKLYLNYLCTDRSRF